MKLNTLKNLYEQGPSDYKGHLNELLGVSNDKRNIDSELDPTQFSIQEMARTFLGADYTSILKDTKFRAAAEYASYTEAGGGDVLPSHFKDLNLFDATVAGLVMAVVIEQFNLPIFIGDSFVTNEDSRMNGGKMIGVKRESGVDHTQNLLSGEAAPSISQQTLFKNIPENLRQHQVMEINRDAVTYDLTGLVMENAADLGKTIARNREINIARVVQGLDNPYSVEDTSGNTYLSTAGAGNFNYVNADQINLSDWTDLDEAMQLLQNNRDPQSNWEIDISPETMKLYVSPAKQMTVSTILRQTEVRTATNSAVETRLSPNPLPVFPLFASTIWRNQLTDDSVSDVNDVWLLVNPKAFGYRTIYPMQTNQIQIGPEESRKGTIAFFEALHTGVPYVKEPRFAGKFTKE